MNIEIGIKVKIKNLKKVRDKLRNYGKLFKSIKQIDEYYIPCHRDFFTRRPFPVEWLRIRTDLDRTIFEYDRSINKTLNAKQKAVMEFLREVHLKYQTSEN